MAKKKNSKGAEKEKESKRRRTQQLKLRKIHTKIRNKRKDFLQKLTCCMITKYNYDGFILEDLSSKNMMKNHKLAKSISDVSWSEFSRILEYKSKWNFKYFEKIDRYVPSSQICNKCGNRQDMSLSKRIYNCSNCGNVIDRDLNASRNIKDFSSITTLGTNGIYRHGEISKENSMKCQKEQLLISWMPTTFRVRRFTDTWDYIIIITIINLVMIIV